MSLTKSPVLLCKYSATRHYVCVVLVLPHGPIEATGSPLFSHEELCRMVLVLNGWCSQGPRAGTPTFVSWMSFYPTTFLGPENLQYPGTAVVEPDSTANTVTSRLNFPVTIWYIVQAVHLSKYLIYFLPHNVSRIAFIFFFKAKAKSIQLKDSIYTVQITVDRCWQLTPRDI